ncbi:MAG: ROK family protein [Patescibacteria group bacterium]
MVNLYLGIDLGGSHISSWLFYNKAGESWGPFSRMSIDSDLGPDTLVSLLTDCIKSGQRVAQCNYEYSNDALAAVGLASPGPLDPKNGIIISPPNLPNIRNVEIVKLLQQSTGLQTFLVNDADAAVLGEQLLGSARGFNNVVMLTLGTGIGSGIIADGKLQRGRGMGGEWGHTAIASIHSPGNRLCSCGRLNCLEVFCGTEGLALTYGNIFKARREDLTPDFVREISKQMRKKTDERLSHLFNVYCSDLTEGIINIINVHHPECVVLGGGIACEDIVERVSQLLANVKHKLAVISRGVVIKLAANSNSGIIGAVVHAMDSMGESQ